MGRLIKDPTLAITPNEMAVTRFTLAINNRYKKQGENAQADLFNIVCYKKTADFVKKYFKKGQLICLSGFLQNRSWEYGGHKHQVTEVVANEVHFTGDKRENDIYDSSNDDFLPVNDDQLPF